MSVVIVGAGLGGLRAAESLRANGYTGPISVVGDESHLPYNRPPLSKESLLGGVDVAALEFRRKAIVDDVTWVLGSGVVSSDFAARTVTLADGRVLEFDGLVIASGIRPRRLPIPGPQAGRHVIRTAQDSHQLREDLTGAHHMLMMGAGFIGCETAATGRKLDTAVTIVALDAEPMVRPLGLDLGAAMRRRHEAHDVAFHLGTSITEFLGDGRVQAARLSDGTEIETDLVVEAIGSVANVEWLEGNGLDLSDGVHTDHTMRALGTEVPVVAVGDIARHPNGLFGGAPRRIEHWNMPTETGKRAGATLAALLEGLEPDPAPFTAMPSFWSDQYDTKIQSFGMPGIATSIAVVDGSVDGACIVEYSDDTGLVGVVGIDRTSDLAQYRTTLMGRTVSA
jgi:NADPH-dependent 2,4-dienoyl-CoA reductase/sulfur reductase-like enzyme